ncbi:pH-response regulator protein palF/RIM8 [[Candida] railenensis]|uniref:pH-response regulator protein palF/RIM8 n=1 Tax=[Candida] railenensis TaxID=45579 RepID=A0A9P0W1N1_9ASCO|nr:pH-response regulator protein palF/RIM8 [[Candida] railenensis]
MRRAVSRIIPSRQKNSASSVESPTAGLAGDSIPSFIEQNTTMTDTNHLPYTNFKMEFNSIAEFYITLDDPHKSWLPGDEVSGQIILISRKNLANIAITLSLVGCVKINASSHSKLRPIKHTLFNHTIKIYGDEDDVPTGGEDDFKSGLYKGEHRFPFIVKLPNKRVYTSINFGKGAIVYSLKAAIGNISNSAAAPNVTTPTTTNNTSVSGGSGANGGSSGNSPCDTSSPSAHKNIIAKAKQLKMLNSSTYTSEKLINLINPIDVAKLPPSKPKRLILKDPRSSSSKGKNLARTQSSTSTLNTFTTVSSNTSDSVDTNTTMQEGTTPTQPSNNSQLNITPNVINNGFAIAGTPLSSENSSSQKKPDTIKVSLGIPNRGYLRGELIPIKLNINHLKKIQDLSGIIITFVRVCRLDNGPDGLYESFRKDLYQSVIPLYVDPNTFQSEINTSVRVPADSFPTISGCPLVSFQYFIEVLINLSGKSLSIDGNDSKNSGSPKDSIMGAANAATGAGNFNFQPHGSFNSKERSTYINTDKYKRMKKFLQLTTEVIVGTHRSKIVTQTTSNDESVSLSPIRRSSSSISGQSQSYSQPPSVPPPLQSQLPQPSISPALQESGARNSPPIFNSFSTPPYIGDRGPVPEYNETTPSGSDSLIPLPQQNHLSEKEQMRLREVSLLPSAPPLDDIEEDIDGVSPIDRNDDILQHLHEQNQAASLNEENPNENTLATGGQPSFSYFDNDNTNDHNNENQNLDNEVNIDDDLYSELDLVPNYELANNDRLVPSSSNQ